MKTIFALLGRLTLISTAAIGIATVSNLANHRSYWYGTIQRVQTTDFNILSSMLPTKLSYALLEDDVEEIQRTLNSNYGLFGMVVTDCTTTAQVCPDQQILHMTQSERGWSQELHLDNLHHHPFDLLRDPPPLQTEWSYQSTRADHREPTHQQNAGQIIGRVYYVRGIPPSFAQDYQRWVGNLLSNSGTHRYYSLTTALFLAMGLSAWSFIEWLLHRKGVQKQQALMAQQQSRRENDILRRQLKQRSAQLTELIAERESFALQLQTYEQEQDERTHQLNQQIVKLEQQLQQTASVDNTQQLTQAQSALLDEIEQRGQTIASLQQKLQTQTQSSSQNTQAVETLKQELAKALKQQASARTQLEQNQSLLDHLQQQNRQKDQKLHEMTQLLEQWRQSAEAAKQREAESAKQREEDFKRSLLAIQQEKAALEETIKQMDTPNLDRFEQAIVDRLQSTSKFDLGQWLVLSHLDVQPGKSRQFVDVLLIGKSYVVVIEAKNFDGVIKARGTPKLTPWFSQRLSGAEVPIASVGTNPYAQVNGYVDSVMKKLRNEVSANRVVVYGVVVFAEKADVSFVSNSIGKYSRVTTLGNLLSVIDDLETAAAFKTRAAKLQRSPHQIQDLLYGLPMRRSA
ncbi:NERD domain-containing protein [Egbenema bharatensis]|uniref:NERD domain-containing protein n=1 Tax=Egbenema bharatensis TaxID=3463334 RepID=UPI003A84F4C5